MPLQTLIFRAIFYAENTSLQVVPGTTHKVFSSNTYWISEGRGWSVLLRA